MGYYHADSGRIEVDGAERLIHNPKDAHTLGIGMVYQHFTLVPAMTVAENLVMARFDVPSVIDWKKERAALEEFMTRTPFAVPIDARISDISAGERQKTEILKQLYLDRRFLILDEPTSVLTPDEADEMLSLLRGLTREGVLTILMISHKFREVFGYADHVTVLRKGEFAGSGAVADLSQADLAAMMIGDAELPQSAERAGKPRQVPVLAVHDLKARDSSGLRGIAIDRLYVHSGEIVGIAGISGNGQTELVEVLGGQREKDSGEVIVKGELYGMSRTDAKEHKVRCLPEEPLRNASVPRMSVAENLAFRDFDSVGGIWLETGRIANEARHLIGAYAIKTASKDAPIATLSGGNVQRTVLARELSGEVELLIVANPCFGLDFAAVAEIRSQLVAARNRGAGVLLVSEDLDEILELADQILVMSEGKIVYQAASGEADRTTLGHHMAGHH